MSAAGVGGLRRMSRVLNGLRIISYKPSLHHAAVRTFYLQSACEATRKIEMPSLSPTMAAGTIVKWTKKEGDAVSPGDVLCEIQTDKAVVGFEYEDEGVLAKILKGDDSKDVPVGAIIAVIVDVGEDWKNASIPEEAEAGPLPTTATAVPQVYAATPAPASARAPPAASAPVKGPPTPADWHLIGPSAKLLLQDYNIDAKVIPRSGPGGSLLKSDILNYISSKGLKKVDLKADRPQKIAAPAPTALTSSLPPPLPPLPKEKQAKPISPSTVSATDIPLTNMRKVIARRLTESKGVSSMSAHISKTIEDILKRILNSPDKCLYFTKLQLTTIPHAYATIDCSMQAVMKLRKKLADDGVKVSVNDFIIKAAGFALKDSPQVNSTWQGDAAQSASSVDISVAVATEEGLITPIIKNVPSLGMAAISSTVKTLADKARDGKLKPEEFIGGTFCISNLGMYGITEFSAVINPPQVAILAVGATRPCPAPDCSIDPRMSVTLSYDSRALNELEATEFLEKFQTAMENPELLTAGSMSCSVSSRVEKSVARKDCYGVGIKVEKDECDRP